MTPTLSAEELERELNAVRLSEEEAKRHGSGATYWNNAVFACQCVIRDAGARQPQPATLEVVGYVDSDDETAAPYVVLANDCDHRDGTQLCRLTDAQRLVAQKDAEIERLQRAEKNDAIAYKAALERQDELRAQLDAIQAARGEEPLVVATAILGGLFHGGSGPELGEIDVEVCAPHLEKIQCETVNSSDDVFLPLMTVAQHRHIVAAMAAEVEQFKAANADLQLHFDTMRTELDKLKASEPAAEQNNDARRCQEYDAKAHELGYPNVLLALAELAVIKAQPAPDVVGLVEALRKAFVQMRNVAAGYSNYCEDSASTRRLEREFQAADDFYRSIAANRGGKGE